MLGQNAEQFPEIVKQLKDAGMELGNHTYDHQILTTLSEDQISDEIRNADAAIEKGAGVPAEKFKTAGRKPGRNRAGTGRYADYQMESGYKGLEDKE